MKIEVGTWGFVTGNRRISSDTWKRSFPNDWFGKVIEKNGKLLTLRCYRGAKDKRDRKDRHPHLTGVEQKFFKSFEQ